MAETSETKITPVRGTQSFVGIMVEVWKRPSLTGMEILWRWAFGLAAIPWAVSHWGKSFQPTLQLISANGLAGLGAETFGPLERDLRSLLHALRGDVWIAVAACAVWIVLSTWGRGRLLKRLDPTTQGNFRALLGLSVARVAALVLVLAGWVNGVLWAANAMILSPLSHRTEPALIPFAALLIAGTLALFVGWMAVSFAFQLAPVFAVEKKIGAWKSYGAAWRRGVLRGKIIEINLVLGIVKIALLVLALVFSACPLPFSSVETQDFLLWWTAGVIVWYLVASDFFHAVRTAVCLRFWQVYENDAPTGTISAEIAS